MKKPLLTFFSFLALSGFSQGFSPSSFNWSAPDGGKITGGNFYGFNHVFNTANFSETTGSQSWFTQDMNGDKVVDLVVAAQIQDGDLTCFSPGLNQYWKVYINNWTGFSSSPINWNLPNGGAIRGGIIFGFDNSSGTANTSDNAGSQTWSLMDMDGDNKPDLVIAGQLQGGNVTCFSPGSGASWKVYKNTGNGFSATPITWNLPNGGKLSGGTTYGFNSTSGMAFPMDNTGSQTWSLADMNGDNKVDLVVTAQLQGGNITCFSPGSSQYWKVYLNNGSSFDANATNWDLPNGGKLKSGITYGFDALDGLASPSDNTGSQSWFIRDMNGDQKPELVIAAQLQGGNVTCFSPGSGQYWKVFANTSTAFATTSSNWDLPNGGKISGGITYGFNSQSGNASPSDNTGSQSWALIDLDGYSSPELVITAQLQGGNVTCFSPGNNQYWKVFKNTTTGFSTVNLDCSLPNGGKLAGGVSYGFNTTFGTALTFDNTGSQSWGVTDMTGDNIPDLIVAGQLQAGLVSSFSPASSQYWKVYKSDFLTGINEMKLDKKLLSVYPNPNNGSFIISGSAKEKLTLTNEIGQLIKTFELNDFNNYSSEINDLKSGVYFVSGKQSYAKIVVIQ